MNCQISMICKGECHDNAAAESFFSHPKDDLIYRNTLITKEEAIKMILDFIKFFNANRLHSSLDYMSPVEYKCDITAALHWLNQSVYFP